MAQNNRTESTPYVIVAESGCDIPADQASDLGIEIVPMHVSLGGRTFDDGEIPATKMLDQSARTGELPRTSGCTPGDFASAFARIHNEQPEAIIIHLAYSAVTTCSMESARTAAKNLDYVHSIDTKAVTAGQGAIVLDTARFIASHPGALLDDVLAFVESLRNRARMAFIPGDLEFLRAGGRLSNAAFLGASLLRIKPVVEIIDGKLVASKKLRGSMVKASVKLLDHMVANEEIDRERVRLIRSPGLRDTTQIVIEAHAHELGFKSVEWVNTGCVISSHCGPGTFGAMAYAAK